MTSDIGLWIMGYAFLAIMIDGYKTSLFGLIVAHLLYVIGGLVWVLD